MNSDELLTLIKKLINNMETSPKFLSFAVLGRNVKGDDETREAWKELVRTKKIRVREGINHNLIEVL